MNNADASSAISVKSGKAANEKDPRSAAQHRQRDQHSLRADAGPLNFTVRDRCRPSDSVSTAFRSTFVTRPTSGMRKDINFGKKRK